MKTKACSFLIGAVNGGLLSITPLFLYNYVLSKSPDTLGATDMALRGVLGAVLLVLMANTIVMVLLHKMKAKELSSAKPSLFVFAGWLVATAILAYTGRSSLFFESESDPTGAFGLILSMANLISVVIAMAVAKLIYKRATTKPII